MRLFTHYLLYAKNSFHHNHLFLPFSLKRQSQVGGIEQHIFYSQRTFFFNNLIIN